MKWLLFITVFFASKCLFAQRFDLELWKKKEGLKNIPEVPKRIYKVFRDSLSRTFKLNEMPNAFTGSLPSPKLVGNNGKGQNIYILPIDNMPMIKPDSTYSFKMPVAGFQRQKPAQ